MKKWILIAVAIVAVLICTFMVVKKVSPVGWGWWGEYNTSSGLALKGYDPVAYFNDMKPVEGRSEYTYEWNGATWQFDSAGNKALFAGDPESYAAQFGGFCSFAVSKGFTADIAPDAWHIENGKLYVFADQNVRDDWVASIDDGSLEASAANWAKR